MEPAASAAGSFLFKNPFCLCYPAKMKEIKALPVAFLLILLTGLLTGSLFAMPQKPKTPQRPAGSLDLLLSRIDAYWNLLLQKKKAQAAQYIAASDRDAFLNNIIPQFFSWKIKGLEFSDDRTEAKVTLVVKRSLPSMGTLDWPVTEEWRLQKGNWYRDYKPSFMPLPISNTDLKPKSNRDQAKEAIRRSFRIETPVLDFGTVQQGKPAKLSLKYTLAGDKDLPVKIQTPSGIRNSEKAAVIVFTPGKDRELTFEVQTWLYEGSVNERIVLEARRDGVVVPFEAIVEGNVYVPVSMSPKFLDLNAEEREKEIKVRNNSKEKVELSSLFTESGKVGIEPLPVTLSPGQEITLKARWLGETALSTDNTVISFASPVDGVAGLSLPVYMRLRKATGDPVDILLKSIDGSRSCRARPALE